MRIKILPEVQGLNAHRALDASACAELMHQGQESHSGYGLWTLCASLHYLLSFKINQPKCAACICGWKSDSWRWWANVVVVELKGMEMFWWRSWRGMRRPGHVLTFKRLEKLHASGRSNSFWRRTSEQHQIKLGRAKKNIDLLPLSIKRLSKCSLKSSELQ